MYRAGIVLILIAGATGTACSNLPFKAVQRVPVGNFDPLEVRDRYAATVPHAFIVEQTVIFQLGLKEMTAYGMLSVDHEGERFRLVAMTPLLFKLFDVSGEGGRTTCEFALDAFEEKEGMAEAIGQDIYSIYFDLIPPSSASVSKGETEIVFEKSGDVDRVVYLFAGPKMHLIEKRYDCDGALMRTVRYFEYIERDGKNYPTGIVLDNDLYGYRLVIRLKEIRESD